MSVEPIIYAQERVLSPREILRRDITKIAVKHGTTISEVMRGARHIPVVRARMEAIRHVNAIKPSWSSVRIAEYFGKDHSTVLYALGRLSNRKPSNRLKG